MTSKSPDMAESSDWAMMRSIFMGWSYQSESVGKGRIQDQQVLGGVYELGPRPLRATPNADHLAEHGVSGDQRVSRIDPCLSKRVNDDLAGLLFDVRRGRNVDADRAVSPIG